MSKIFLNRSVAKVCRKEGGMVKGFKGFNQDLTCRGFQYEIGKTYEYNGKIELCSSGFHFCRKLQDVYRFYDLKTSRICEIEADGKIDNDNAVLLHTS